MPQKELGVDHKERIGNIAFENIWVRFLKRAYKHLFTNTELKTAYNNGPGIYKQSPSPVEGFKVQRSHEVHGKFEVTVSYSINSRSKFSFRATLPIFLFSYRSWICLLFFA